MADGKEKKEYKAESIRVLEGLEAVRKRPAMYIGSTGPHGLHHLVYEVVDNSVDEALAGHATDIKVILHKDGSCSVEDNGRGIPTDIHPGEGVSAAEVVLTKLHAGGKFDKDTYKFSGGLHGVGISVVNALSSRVDLTIFQHGSIHEMSFERGKPLGKLKITGSTTKRGTLVRFWPDPEIFQETVNFSFEVLSARLRELAFLNKNLSISIADERTGKSHEFHFEGGIISFVQHINEKKTALFNDVVYFEKSDDVYVLEVAFQYNDGYGEQLFSFVNNINTTEGGTHVSGFKSALTKACNKKALEFHILKEGESFSSEDVREGLVCVINMKVPEPQFEGQTKTKLGNNDVKGLVDSWTFAFLERYFEENPSVAKKILQKAELAMSAREAARKARDLARRKNVLESMILPGKLADCSNEDPTQTELFIVEGDSAGGSAKQGRDRHTQAILPLKGKILNVEKARLDKILSNDEIKNLISAIGCGIGATEFDATKARYHKIILMTDADVDGAHIRTLLLTFFFRYMQPLIEKGYLYIAQPPLYKAKIGKKEQYLKDDKALKSFLFNWTQETTALWVNNKEIAHDAWQKTLDAIHAFDDQLSLTAATYRLSQEHCNELAHIMANHPWQESEGTPALLATLQKAYKDSRVTMDQHVTQETSSPLIPINAFVSFARLNEEWTAPLAFFTSPELHALQETRKPLAHIEGTTWKLQVIDKERNLTGNGLMALVNAINAISKPYMNIQRYKGLGEMNPEQLWETSMDAKQRMLLKVTIEDALEADTWFTTLMGDDVSGRKQYIEQFGHFVKNLDV